MFGTEGQEYEYHDEDALEDDNGGHHSLHTREAVAENGSRGAEIGEENVEQADTAESSVTVGPDEIHDEIHDEIQYDDGLDEDNLDGSNIAEESKALNGATKHSVGVEDEDEIDYEDDEAEDDNKEDLEPTTPPESTPAIPSSNGKRSRADVEPDEFVGNEAKRPRS